MQLRQEMQVCTKRYRNVSQKKKKKKKIASPLLTGTQRGRRRCVFEIRTFSNNTQIFQQKHLGSMA
jgi:hypothetical protein